MVDIVRESDAAGAATAQGQTKVQLHLPLRIGNAASQAFTTFAKSACIGNGLFPEFGLDHNNQFVLGKELIPQ